MAAAKKASAKKEKKAHAKSKESAHLKAIDLRAKTPDELKDMVLQFKKEQFNARFQKMAGEAQKPSRSRAVRKNIARVKTVMSESKKTEAKPESKKGKK